MPEVSGREREQILSETRAELRRVRQELGRVVAKRGEHIITLSEQAPQECSLIKGLSLNLQISTLNTI